MLASDWTTYFVYPQNNRENPFLVIECRHDSKHLRHRSTGTGNSKILFTRDKKSFRDHVEKWFQKF